MFSANDGRSRFTSAGAERDISFSEPQKPIPSLKSFAGGEAGCVCSLTLPWAPGRGRRGSPSTLAMPLQPAPSVLGPHARPVLTRGEVEAAVCCSFEQISFLSPLVSAGSPATRLPLVEAGTN